MKHSALFWIDATVVTVEPIDKPIVTNNLLVLVYGFSHARHSKGVRISVAYGTIVLHYDKRPVVHTSL
jgi:hypothetical protein